MNKKCERCGSSFVVTTPRIAFRSAVERAKKRRFCSHRCRAIRHGHSTDHIKSLTLNSWSMMMDRCTNRNGQNWADYGGRGITVCERWLIFENFLADMGERPPGTTIERVENDLGYEPGNCRWATRKQQSMLIRLAPIGLTCGVFDVRAKLAA